MSAESNEQLCGPIESQNRLLIDTLDLEPSQLPNLNSSYKELGLIKWTPPIIGPYRTIFFAPNEPLTLPFKVRARMYGISSDELTKSPIHMSPSDFAVLEVKRRTKDHEMRKRREIKYRQVSNLCRIYQAISHLPQAKEILKVNSYDRIPYGYPKISDIPNSVFTELDEMRIPLYPAYVYTSCRDHWIIDGNDPDRLRITIDSNYFYHTLYNTGNLYRGVNIGCYPWVRIEIKIVDPDCNDLAEKAQQLTIRHGGFIPFTRRDSERAYYWNKLNICSSFPLKVNS